MIYNTTFKEAVLLITPEQIRAARALLKWRASDLAQHAGLSLASIQRMEQDQRTDRASAKNVEAVRKTLDDAGIEFIPENGAGVGVRLKKKACI
jgi:transcriptional regulator with XRE-family HTH domain